MTQARAVRFTRPPTATEPCKVRRRERYRHLIESGCPRDDAELAHEHPARYAAAIRALGLEPKPELELVKPGGRPRRTDEASILRTERYHLLRHAGADAVFSSYYCKSTTMYARGMRILAGTEIE